ncbi:MAG: hypothetical protein JXA18_17360 [Chitinispirillaceae bacterium]|nr:hypothetical protein [Chitinispirillaceae bacterium]
MQKMVVGALLSFVALASAQDGIYGSFIVGQKFVDFSLINTELKKIPGVTEDLFPNNNWTFGGEGHLILAKRLVLGGKAFGIMHERVIQGTDPQRRIRMTAGMGVGTLGLNLFKENRFGIHLYPQVGLGASSLVYQSKRAFTDEQKQFDTVLVGTKDNIETLGKFGLILDLAAGFDWYKPFKNFFTIVPGLDVGLLLHAAAGYSFLPGTLKWRRDFDLKGKDQVEGGPDLKFNGFYFNVGVGIGLTAQS